MSKQATEAALEELASETQAAFDHATADRARGKSLDEVDAIFRAELNRRGIEPENTRSISAQIVAAVDTED